MKFVLQFLLPGHLQQSHTGGEFQLFRTANVIYAACLASLKVVSKKAVSILCLHNMNFLQQTLSQPLPQTSLLRLDQDGCKHKQVSYKDILFEGGQKCSSVLKGEKRIGFPTAETKKVLI